MNKLTKIVATLGPASQSAEQIKDLIHRGVNVFRFNFSHGSRQEQMEKARLVRQVADQEGVVVALLQDLAGPKIRTGNFVNDRVELYPGDSFSLVADEITGDDRKVSWNYPQLASQLQTGDIIRLDDGKVALQVIEVQDGEVKTEVLVGGIIASRRGINIPGIELDIEVLTEKDRADVEFFKDFQFDFVSLSFVQSSGDIQNLRSILDKHGIKSAVVGKIETSAAVKNIEEIISSSDAIMVARGDLAIETLLESVPIVQKSIVEKCRHMARPVIVATQMLETMMDIPTPTRAEVSDVANAIFDGADAVMLSGETAAGKYPIQTVEVMASISVAVEDSDMFEMISNRWQEIDEDVEHFATSLVKLAKTKTVTAIVCLTQSGQSARHIARLRPGLPIIAFTPDQRVARQLSLVHGIYPQLIDNFPAAGSDLHSWLPKVLEPIEWLGSGSQVIASYGQIMGKIGGSDTISLIKL